MEFKNFPTSNISNENKNLIFQTSPDGQQNKEYNQNFIEKKSSDNRYAISDIITYIAVSIL